MTLVLSRAVQESASTGVGTINLGDVVSGHLTLKQVAKILSGNPIGPWTVYYFILGTSASGTDFEEGVGTLTAGTPDTLARTTVKHTRYAGTSKVNFTAIDSVGSHPSTDFHDLPLRKHGPATNVATATQNGVYDNTVSSGASSAIPLDGTIPQLTEGTQWMSTVYTPDNADSIIRIHAHVMVACNSGLAVTAALFISSAANATVCAWDDIRSAYPTSIDLEYRWTPAHVSAFSVDVRVGPSSSATLYKGQTNTSKTLGNTFHSFIDFLEMAP